MCSLGSGKHRTPYGDWVIHVPGLGLREHSKPLLGARRKRVLRIAISSGRRRWPVPPVGPPLPRSGPAYTAARSSTRCRSRPGELKTVSRQGPICLLLGGSGRGDELPHLRAAAVHARFATGSGPGTLWDAPPLVRDAPESKPSAVGTSSRAPSAARSAAAVPQCLQTIRVYISANLTRRG